MATCGFAEQAGTKMVSAGNHCTMIVKTDHTLWATGFNYSGGLGVGSKSEQPVPVQVMTDVATVSVGNLFTLVLKTDGTLWAMGENEIGQLGDGTRIDRFAPVQIMNDVTSASAGIEHSLIVKTDGTLWTVGSNADGELGDGTTTHRSTPLQIMDDVASASAGYNHSMIVKTDGTLWAVGGRSSGQLGDGTPGQTDNYTWSRSTPVNVMSGVRSVSAGSLNTMIVKKDGTLWAVGNNNGGELGVGDTIDRDIPVQVMSDVSTVELGSFHTMIIKTDGTLWAMGDNSRGQLGVGDTIDRFTPVQVMSNVSSVSLGVNHTMIIKTDGTLWAMGDNYYGQLCNLIRKGPVVEIPTTPQLIPVQITFSNSDVATLTPHVTNKSLISCITGGNIQFSQKVPSGTTVSLFDLSGKKLVHTTIIGSIFEVPNFSRGVYIARINTGSALIQQKIMIE